jgi:hypothetical protein
LGGARTLSITRATPDRKRKEAMPRPTSLTVESARLRLRSREVEVRVRLESRPSRAASEVGVRRELAKEWVTECV